MVEAKRKILAGSWDKGYEFEDLLNELRENFLSVITADNKQGVRNSIYYAVMLIQLVNGARISEAVDGFLEFIKTGEDRIIVRVRKQRGENMRIIVIPDVIKKYRKLLKTNFEDTFNDAKNLIQNVKKWASRRSMNTHALRHAAITYYLTKTKNPIEVARITGHKNINTLITYFQKLQAVETLEKTVNELFNNK